MKNYAKVGNRAGKPAYRTPSHFRQKVFAVVRKIPHGKTMSYGEVARAIGLPDACRAVGAALKTNFDPAIPCHRVVRADGTLGGYNRGVGKKKKLLHAEHSIHQTKR